MHYSVSSPSDLLRLRPRGDQGLGEVGPASSRPRPSSVVVAEGEVGVGGRGNSVGAGLRRVGVCTPAELVYSVIDAAVPEVDGTELPLCWAVSS